ncbi:hypothetical protein [Nonomuraea sp. NPDC052265]|uniref:hypothetical protein n=1 Tax=Nonomuraea sp. NPDC052265 TaxID=3364374 RepID=UPI0037CCB4A4
MLAVPEIVAPVWHVPGINAVAVPGFRRHTVWGLHVAVGGERPAVPLLPGFPQTHLARRHVGPLLADRFHVVCPGLQVTGNASGSWTMRALRPDRPRPRRPGRLPDGHFLPESQPEAVAEAIGKLLV